MSVHNFLSSPSVLSAGYTFMHQQEAKRTLHRLRRNQPLTPGNNDKLRHFLLSQGFGTEQAIQQSAEECNGFGLFNRSLVGVPRTRPQRLLALWLSSPPQQPEHQAQGC